MVVRAFLNKSWKNIGILKAYQLKNKTYLYLQSPTHCTVLCCRSQWGLFSQNMIRVLEDLFFLLVTDLFQLYKYGRSSISSREKPTRPWSAIYSFSQRYNPIENTLSTLWCPSFVLHKATAGAVQWCLRAGSQIWPELSRLPWLFVVYFGYMWNLTYMYVSDTYCTLMSHLIYSLLLWQKLSTWWMRVMYVQTYIWITR